MRRGIALDIGVLLRLSRPNKCNLDALLLCPLRRDAAYVLRTIITAYRSRLTTPLNDLVQRPHNAFRWQGEVTSIASPSRLKSSITLNNHATTIGKLVMHEVHQPGLVDGCRYGNRRLVFLLRCTVVAWIRRFSSSSR